MLTSTVSAMLLVPLLAARAVALNFTTSNGQIFTPGLVIVDSPQPYIPLGGDTLEVALDVSGNGKLQLPPYQDDASTRLYNVTIFLYSYDTGRNLTITNGTATANNASLGDIMLQESGSTVKHVDWLWPACLVGNGQPTTKDSDRGAYNISIHQRFRLNGDDHYTIFDLPISVTNSIEANSDRSSCDSLENSLLTPEQVDVAGANDGVPYVFAPNSSTVVQTDGSSSSSGSGDKSRAATGPALGGNWAQWLCLLWAGMTLSF